MPLISVVIPTHDRPDFLAEALASVRAQTFTDYEIIIVSDSETAENRDLSRTVAARFDCRYFTVSYRNPSKTRNFGVEQAKGEWIAFLDDDDLWLPAKLERQIADARRTGADMIACDLVDFFPDGRERISRCRIPEDWSYVKALSHEKFWGPPPSAVLLRRTAFHDEHGFDPNLRTREDSDLWRRISWRHAIFQMDEILVRCRTGHPSLSKDRREAHRNDLRLYIKILRDTPPDLRWAVPTPATLLCRWLLKWYFPAWVRQPRKQLTALRCPQFRGRAVRRRLDRISRRRRSLDARETGTTTCGSGAQRRRYDLRGLRRNLA
jgi:glycosyltransferase involved in cell wall biosynthesis